MTDEKKALIEQMKQQRFLPITEDTFRLYQTYASLIEPNNPEEISYLLLYEGECFFRLGNYNEALSRLNRCLQAPKPDNLKYLDALAYNVLGLIYSVLEQETTAINRFLQCYTISTDYHLDREAAASCMNLGQIYYSLGDYDSTMRYYDQALTHIARPGKLNCDLALLCQSYRGIIFCKKGNIEQALESHRLLLNLLQFQPDSFYNICVFNLGIRLADITNDDALRKDNFSRFLNRLCEEQAFPELFDYYFDVCSYLLEANMQKKARAVLDCMHKQIDSSPLVFLHYNLQKFEMTYAKQFLDAESYRLACGEFFRLRTEYQRAQQIPKRYSLEYIERVSQLKSDSDMYREKSQLDPMTGLLNKYTIRFLAEEDLSNRKQNACAMILIDLDHFKQINDTLGHLAGDRLICKTASVIKNFFKDNALCGRVGGDEFLIYQNNVSSCSSLLLQAELLRQEIFQQTSDQNITITTQASIGVAFSSSAECDYESLFSAADTALYQAKTSGRNRVVVADSIQ